jgi:hypothetical protein
VLAVFTLSELGEAATGVGLGEGSWETAKRACFSGWYDSEVRSFQRFMIQQTSGPALLKIRHRNSDLRILTSSKMGHDSILLHIRNQPYDTRRILDEAPALPRLFGLLSRWQNHNGFV